MEDFAFLSIKQLQSKLERKEISKKELLQYFIARIKKYDELLGSMLEVFDEQSIITRSNDAARTPLAGIPGLLKDVICQKARITSCGSKMLENYWAPYDATVVERLKESGAYLAGRTNCDEFAMGSSTELSAFHPTRNPWDRSRVPGGSSGGSAAAVAAGFAPWALGSETGGSVRQPAALCGIVGLKPTYGLVSRYGVVAYGSSVDQISPFARTVEDVACVLSVIAGKDARDATSLDVERKDYTRTLTGALKKGLKIGVIENAMTTQGIETDVMSALEKAILQLKLLGADIKHLRLGTMDYSAAIYFILSRAEAASNLARFDGVRYGLRVPAESVSDMYMKTRREGFGLEVRRRILIGNYVLSVGHADEYYNNAVTAMRMMRAEFDEAFKQVDLLFLPVTGTGAFKIGAFAKNGIGLDLQDYFTCPANLTGLPALSVPCGFTRDKLPIGFQLMGPQLAEELLLQTAHAYEQETEWHKQHPQLA